MKTTFKVPVSWREHATMYIDAETPEEAIKIAYNSSLPTDGEYSDDSFQVIEDEVEEDQ